MNEVQLKILGLIEDGKISVDEAVKLLEATSGDKKSFFSNESRENVEKTFEDFIEKLRTSAKNSKSQFDKQFSNKEETNRDPLQQLDESLQKIIRSFNQNKDL